MLSLGSSLRRWKLPLALLAIAGVIAALPAVLGGTAAAIRQQQAVGAAPSASSASGTVWHRHGPRGRGHHRHGHHGKGQHHGLGPTSSSKRPNIVFVLTDDLSMDLVRYMPQVRALQARGLTFNNYFVSDSLCCPSRASIFTGNFPHDTGVFTNTGRQGGFNAFRSRGEQHQSFNVALQRAGYTTAMMGKYLNGYLDDLANASVPPTYVPTGWNEWDVAGWGYPEYDYRLNHDGAVRYYGHKPRDYLTNVLARAGVHFIDHQAHSRKPFFLELATFAPHTPYTPASRYKHAFPGLKAPEPPSFNAMPTQAPDWLADHRPLTPWQIRKINRVFRKRAQAVQSVDDMVVRIERALRRHRMLHNTYIVFSSDNGLHTGEYRLMPGKLTAFDTDIHVPLVIAGPGVRAGSTTNAMAENIDLAKTFEQIAGTTLPSDGHNLVPLFEGGQPAGWRDAVLVEHHGPVTSRNDPDIQSEVSGNPPSYEALRTPDLLYVEYKTGQREIYDLRTDPWELHNLVSTLGAAELAQLHADLLALKNCHTGHACWAAAHIDPTVASLETLRRG
jgi:N-acetylglucosamine-6-sulfatase